MILDSHEDAIVNALAVEQALKSLSPDLQAVLHKLYFLDQTHDQVAVDMNVSTRTVRNLEREALDGLRLEFA